MLKLFTERHRNEVMVRIATLDGIQPAALKDLNEVMGTLLSGADRVSKSTLGGVKAAAEMLNLMGASVETSVLDYIREIDNELAQQIMDNMFTFDDLIKVDDKAIQALLKEVQTESLVIALKGARPSCATRSSGTCRPAPPRPCAKSSSRAARSASPRSRPSRRKCSRSCAASSRKA